MWFHIAKNFNWWQPAQQAIHPITNEEFFTGKFAFQIPAENILDVQFPLMPLPTTVGTLSEVQTKIHALGCYFILLPLFSGLIFYLWISFSLFISAKKVDMFVSGEHDWFTVKFSKALSDKRFLNTSSQMPQSLLEALHFHLSQYHHDRVLNEVQMRHF